MSTSPDYYVTLEQQTNGPKGGKFWTVSVYGQKVILHWGALSTKGQTREKVFGNPASAMKYAARRENEKLSEGYRSAGRNRPQKSAANLAAKAAPPPPAPEPKGPTIPIHRAIVWDF